MLLRNTSSIELGILLFGGKESGILLKPNQTLKIGGSKEETDHYRNYRSWGIKLEWEPGEDDLQAPIKAEPVAEPVASAPAEETEPEETISAEEPSSAPGDDLRSIMSWKSDKVKEYAKELGLETEGKSRLVIIKSIREEQNASD